MSEPRTAAGRALLDELSDVVVAGGSVREYIVAIEDEARQQGFEAGARGQQEAIDARDAERAAPVYAEEADSEPAAERADADLDRRLVERADPVDGLTHSAICASQDDDQPCICVPVDDWQHRDPRCICVMDVGHKPDCPMAERADPVDGLREAEDWLIKCAVSAEHIGKTMTGGLDDRVWVHIETVRSTFAWLAAAPTASDDPA